MSHEARRARVATTLVFLLNGSLLGVWATEVAPLRERLALSAAVLGGVLLCGAAGALLAMPLSARLIARFGTGQVIQAGAVATCLALAGAVAAPTLWVLCLCLLGFGAGFGTVDVAMNAEAVRVEQRAGRPVLSSVHGMWSLGSFCGSAGGAALLGVVTPAVQIALVAGTCGVALLGAGAMLRRPRSEGAPVATDVPVAEGSPSDGGAAPRRGRRLWTRPGLLLAGAMMSLSFAVEGAVLDWGAVYLREVRHLPVASAAAGFSAFSITMMVLRFGGDRVRARLGNGWVLRASLGATAGFALLLWATPLWLSLAGFALAGAGVANVVPVLFGLAGNQGGAGRDAADASGSYQRVRALPGQQARPGSARTRQRPEAFGNPSLQQVESEGLPLAESGGHASEPWAFGLARLTDRIQAPLDPGPVRGAGTREAGARELEAPGFEAEGASARTAAAVGIASILGYAGVLGGPPMFGLIAQVSSVGVALGVAGMLCGAVGLAGGWTVRLSRR